MRKCASSNGSWCAMGIGELCGLFIFLRDRSMIRRACGDSYVKRDVYIDAQKVRGGYGGARGIRRGVRVMRRGAGDAWVLQHNLMCRAVCRAKLCFSRFYCTHGRLLLRVCWQVGSGHVYKAVREELRCVEGSLALFPWCSPAPKVFANEECSDRQ